MEIKLGLGNWQQSFFFSIPTQLLKIILIACTLIKNPLSKSVVYLGHLSGTVVLRPPRIVV